MLHRALGKHYGPEAGSAVACRDGIFIIAQLSCRAGRSVARPWAPRPIPRPQSIVHAFAERFSVGGVTAITSVARLELDATPQAPAHSVHVLQRSLTGERVEPFFFLVTDG